MATGNPTPSVQWQVSTNGGSSFTPISGATSATLSLSPTTASQNGYIYQAVFSNSLGSATTSRATLTVHYAPSVTSNPTSQSVTVGGTATMTAAATGNPTASVQWQSSSNGGGSFASISGATHSTLTLSGVTISQNGYLYRAVFTNSIGSATTTAATLSVSAAPTVSASPTGNAVGTGQNVTQRRRDHRQSQSDRVRTARHERRHVVRPRATKNAHKLHPHGHIRQSIKPQTPHRPHQQRRFP